MLIIRNLQNSIGIKAPSLYMLNLHNSPCRPLQRNPILIMFPPGDPRVPACRSQQRSHGDQGRVPLEPGVCVCVYISLYIRYTIEASIYLSIYLHSLVVSYKTKTYHIIIKYSLWYHTPRLRDTKQCSILLCILSTRFGYSFIPQEYHIVVSSVLIYRIRTYHTTSYRTRSVCIDVC